MALRVDAFVEGRKRRNCCVQGDMELDSLVECLVSNAVYSRLECSNKLVFPLVNCVCFQ